MDGIGVERLLEASQFVLDLFGSLVSQAPKYLEGLSGRCVPRFPLLGPRALEHASAQRLDCSRVSNFLVEVSTRTRERSPSSVDVHETTRPRSSFTSKSL